MQEYERWDEIKILWKSCGNFRRNFLLDDESENITIILTEWPLYKHPMGSSLVSIFCSWYYCVELSIIYFINKC